MQFIYNDISLLHDTGEFHPECAARLSAFQNIPQTELPDAEHLLTLVHTEKHIERIKKAAKNNEQIDGDTIASADSFAAAKAGVSAAVLASETQGFSLMRPPGHHAYAELASGFCLFNGIAVAAQKLAEAGKKVLIFDFDGHFGDGTSDIFYESDKVLYWSLHQEAAFPFKGAAHEIGAGKGIGYNWNMPIPRGSGDDVFRDILQTFIPLVKQFAPDVVGISAGFDAHKNDPLLQLSFSINGYYEAGKMLATEFSDVFVVLEGGYNLEFLPHCIRAFHAGIEGRELEMKMKMPETNTEKETYDIYEKNKQLLLGHLSPYFKI